MTIKVTTEVTSEVKSEVKYEVKSEVKSEVTSEVTISLHIFFSLLDLQLTKSPPFCTPCSFKQSSPTFYE